MKVKFYLTTEPGLTGFKLRKSGEVWEYPFSSIPRAMRYAHAIAHCPSEMIILTPRGQEIAHVKV
jgi:hypothetical protein